MYLLNKSCLTVIGLNFKFKKLLFIYPIKFVTLTFLLNQ